MAAVNGKTCYISTISQKNERLPRGVGGSPCSLVPFQSCFMFPCSHTFSFFVPRLINLLTTYHRPQFPSPKKTREEKRHQKKLIKEETRLFVTFNLCDTSSQAFERNSQSIRVGWVSELTLIFLVNHHNTLTREICPLLCSSWSSQCGICLFLAFSLTFPAFFDAWWLILHDRSSEIDNV